MKAGSPIENRRSADDVTHFQALNQETGVKDPSPYIAGGQVVQTNERGHNEVRTKCKLFKLKEEGER